MKTAPCFSIPSRLLLAACLLTGATAPLHAAEPVADWPSKPIRILVGYPAGGSVDSTARIMAQALSQAVGQPVIVENRAGADGSIAVNAVVRAPADGYLLVASLKGAISVAPATSRLPYDPVTDLTAIAPLAQTAEIFVTRPKTGITSLAKLAEGFKRNGNKLSIGYVGAFPRLLAELLAQESKVDFLRVPYKGLPPAMQDLLGDNIDILVGDAVGVLGEQITAGNVVPLAVTSTRRLASMPQVPTTAEAGMPALTGTQWYAVFGPRELPPELLAKISNAVNGVMKQPAQVEQLSRSGLQPFTATPVELANVVKTETRVWKDVAAKSGIKPE